MARVKFEKRKGTVADAISVAYGELSSLAEEAREIVDNAPDGLSSTSRIETFSSTADELENLQEPENLDGVGPLKMEWSEWQNARKGRPLSRADRCGNACAIIDTVIEFLDEQIDKLGDENDEKKSSLEELRDELDNAKSTAEGCEFPGMYG